MGGDVVNQRLWQATVIEVGEDQQVCVGKRVHGFVGEPACQFGADIVLPQLADPQQRLAVGTKPLLERGRAADVANEIARDPILFQRPLSEFHRFVFAGHGKITDVGAEPCGVRRHDAGPAEKPVGFDRHHDESGILLRHAERFAIDVFVND